MPEDSREKILRRIREALSVKAPERHASCRPAGGADDHPATDWLPPVPDSAEAMISLFEKNSADLKTDVRRCPRPEDAARQLASLARENAWKSVATHTFEAGAAAVAALGLPTIFTDQPHTTESLEKCDAGISGCDCLIAQTGGIMVTASSAGGRALSVLPPHHVVIARTSQLVGDLADAFDLLRRSHGSVPAFVSFITGPSRTGDIERILVLGAHGPKKLTVLLVES